MESETRSERENDSRQAKAIELGPLLALSTSSGAGLYFCTVVFQNIVNPGSRVQAPALLLAVIMLLLSTTLVATLFAFVGRLTYTVSRPPGEFWLDFSEAMLRFAVVVTFSVVALSPWYLGVGYVAQVMRKFVGDPGVDAMALGGSLLTALAMVITLRFVPPIWAVVEPAFEDFKKGWGYKTLLGLGLMSVLLGGVLIQGAYVFDARVSQTIYNKRRDVLQVTVTLSGKIYNHDKLRAQLFKIDGGTEKVDEMKFFEIEAGHFVAWRDLMDLNSGVFRIKIFFSNYTEASGVQKVDVWMANNHRERNVIFRLVDAGL